ncbi:RipA family octameric membrane protein [Pseudoneobacillus sp. C159]
MTQGNIEIQTDSPGNQAHPAIGQAQSVQTQVEDKVDLLSVSKETYGGDYSIHCFEQYKLYVEMADRVSSRRMLANTFFLTVNTMLVTVLTALISKLEVSLTWLLPSLIAELTLCFAWWRMVKSYGQLNSGKYQVVNELENYLPIKPYAAEWVILGEGKDPKKYRPLTRVENWIPKIFSVIYVMLAIILMFSSNDISKKTTEPKTILEKIGFTKEYRELPEKKKAITPNHTLPENSKQ